MGDSMENMRNFNPKFSPFESGKGKNEGKPDDIFLHQTNIEKKVKGKENKNNIGIQAKKETTPPTKDGSYKQSDNFSDNTYFRLSGFATEEEEKRQGPKKAPSPEGFSFEKRVDTKQEPVTHNIAVQKEKSKSTVTKAQSKAKSKAQSEPERTALQKAVRILWFPVTLLVVLFVGLIIGHSYLGGQPAGDVFSIQMWEHLYKLIFTK
jgi:hypothetical protein